MKHREYYTAYVEFEDGKSLQIPGYNMKGRIETLEEAKERVKMQQRAYARKDITRIYEDGTKVRVSYSDIYNLKYVIQRHIEDYEVIDEFSTTKIFDDNGKKITEESISL